VRPGPSTVRRDGSAIGLAGETAKAQESSFAVPLLDAVTARGFRPGIAVMDMGEDLTPVDEGFGPGGCHPVIPLR
jgi:hypothetical protein